MCEIGHGRPRKTVRVTVVTVRVTGISGFYVSRQKKRMAHTSAKVDLTTFVRRRREPKKDAINPTEVWVFLVSNHPLASKK